jgi:8-amino-7-oxononanoate synthase
MLDFTSALYLGLRHPSSSLRPWSRFTTGAPAALFSPPEAERIAHGIAALQGCESGVLSGSTLHLFWDLFGMLVRGDVSVFVDSGSYPIARWGVERAKGRGVPVHEFAHHDAKALRRKLEANGQKRLLVVTDGFCPGCGKPAPLPAYLDCIRQTSGLLIVDDTQALGIFGHSPAHDAPYGRGGGGMLPRLQLAAPEILLVSSLAKAFGVPLAVLSGSRKAIEEFTSRSETRVHCSPPAVATLRAAEHALSINRISGDRLRQRLFRLVERFRHAASKAGIPLLQGHFPVQTLARASKPKTRRLHERLISRRVRTVLHRSPDDDDPRISFVITARHTPEAIDRAVAVLSEESERARDSTVDWAIDDREPGAMSYREGHPRPVVSQPAPNTRHWF